MSLEQVNEFGHKRFDFLQTIQESCWILNYALSGDMDVENSAHVYRTEREKLISVLEDFTKLYVEYESMFLQCSVQDVYGKKKIQDAYKLLETTPDWVRDSRIVVPTLGIVSIQEVEVVTAPLVQIATPIIEKFLNVIAVPKNSAVQVATVTSVNTLVH